MPGSSSTIVPRERDDVAVRIREVRDRLAPARARSRTRTQDHLQSLTAADAMTRELVTVTPETTIGEIAQTMRTHRIHRVLVCKQRMLEGVVTTFDLLQTIAPAPWAWPAACTIDRRMPPIDITFRSMAPSPAVEETVQRWVARLEHAFDRIEHCSVVIEVPHRSQRRGKLFRIAIQLGLPGTTIAVSRDPGIDHAHEDIYVAIADAFRAARRKLHEHARILRGEVKLHAAATA